MKKVIAVVCLALFAMPALAAAQQQERTKACTAAATKKGLKGEKHKAYIKSCVAAKKKPETTATSKRKDSRPAATAARSPATPAQPSAASPATPANPPAQSANSASDKKRFRCDEIARQSNVSPARNKDFMDKCMAG